MIQLLQNVLSGFSLRRNTRRVIIFDEGFRNKAYKDTLGNWTIGVGHLIGKDINNLTLSDNIVKQLLKEDLAIAKKGQQRLFGDTWKKWSPARQDAVLSMIFQIGEFGFSKFHSTIAAIRAENWELAASHASQSLWAQQTPKRSERIIFMLQKGIYHADYNINN
jgi:lysozyme